MYTYDILCSEGAQVYISTDVANIENEQVKVSFDLKTAISK